MSEQQTGVGGAEAQKKVEAAWGKFEAELKSYPAAAVAQAARLKVLPDLAGSFAEFRRVGGEITGERAVDMEVEVTAGVIDVVEVDTNREVDDLQVKLEKPEVSEDPVGAAILRQTLNQVLELREGIGDFVGPARRDDFRSRTENVRRGLVAVEVKPGRLQPSEEKPTEEQLLAAEGRIKDVVAREQLESEALKLVMSDAVMVFAGRGLRWDRELLPTVKFLMQRFGLVEKGLVMVEDGLRLKDSELTKLAVVFVSVLPDNKLTKPQSDLLKRAFAMVEGGV